MEGRARTVQVKEVWGQSGEDTTTGKAKWMRRELGLTAYDGYDAYIGTLPLSAKDKWPVGIHEGIERGDFQQLLESMKRIPSADIYPIFDDSLTLFDPSDRNEQDYFLKSPNISTWKGNDTIANIMLAEAKIHETFVADRHPNLGTYLGCVVENGRIVQLAFPKYTETLSSRVMGLQKHGPVVFPVKEREECIAIIEGAVGHLHALGYAHNDISARNIMFDNRGSPMLIDLDSCSLLGTKLAKGGIVGGWRGPMFWGQEFKMSSEECDKLSVAYVKNWLMKIDYID